MYTNINSWNKNDKMVTKEQYLKKKFLLKLHIYSLLESLCEKIPLLPYSIFILKGIIYLGKLIYAPIYLLDIRIFYT